MGEIPLKVVAGKIGSSSVNERVAGYEDLKNVVGQNLRETNLENLNDKGFHTLYEGLFLAASAEKTIYVKSTGVKTRNSARGRLSSCARYFRICVQAGVRKIKPKTARAVVDHVSQTTLIAGERFCEPISLDYTKSLRAVLDYLPYVEHLPSDSWRRAVALCNAGIHIHLDACLEARELSNGQRTLLLGTSLSTSSSMEHNRGRPSSSWPMSSESSKPIAQELLLCLQNLVSASNAPILEKADSIFSTVLRVLWAPSGGGLSHQVAIGITNATLSRINTNLTSLTETAVLELIPLLKERWSTKFPALRDEMLVIMVHIQTYVEKMILVKNDKVLRTDAEGLLQAMQTDYSKRTERDQLQIDDVGLTLSPRSSSPAPPLRVSNIYLRGGTQRSEQCWGIIQVIAMLTYILDTQTPDYVGMKKGKDADGPNKRRRVCMRFESLVRHLMSSDAPTKLCALQTVPFVLGAETPSETEMRNLMDQLTVVVSEETDSLASWGMVAMASCALHKTVQSPNLSSDWLQIWGLALRNATVPSTCRAACHLMEAILLHRLVSYKSIADVIESMISSIDLNGPAMLTDSAISFWTVLLDIRRSEVSSASLLSSERVLHWFLQKWHPAKLTDRSYVAQHALYALPRHALNLLLTCMGHARIRFQWEPVPSYGVIVQAWVRHLEVQDSIRYLLLLDGTGKHDEPKSVKQLEEAEAPLGSVSCFVSIENLLLDCCATEFEQAAQSWTIEADERFSQISSDMVRMLASFCLVGCLLGDCLSSQSSPRHTRLFRSTEDLVSALAAFLGHEDCEQGLVDIALEMIHPFLPRKSLLDTAFIGPSMLQLFLKVGKVLQQRRDTINEPSSRHDPDSMELDSDFASQRSRGRNEMAEMDFPRQDISASATMLSFRLNVWAHLQLLSCKLESSRGLMHETASLHSFLNKISSLKKHEFLACRWFLKKLTSTENLFSRADADQLLVYLAEEYMEDSDYDRCEVALGICLEAMTGLADFWCRDLADNLTDIGATMYQWFINVVVDHGITSPSTQRRTADLLHKLLKVQHDYAKRQSLPSVRTSFLNVLGGGDMTVKFYVARQLPEFFGLIVLRKHESIFEDVMSKLPNDADCSAGIALRLFVFALLGSSWYTVLRRCVYHIFETPGLIPEAIEYATYCLSMIAKALKLAGPRDLLRLFLPQILYTWFESQKLQSVAYSIFDYQDLKSFLLDVQEEAVGQLVMRGDDEEVAILAEMVGVTLDDLVSRWFSKVAAYSIARDICLPPAGTPGQYVGAEMRIRKRLGKDHFLSLINSTFAEILAVFFNCLDEEQQVERAFTRYPQFQYAETLLRQIKGLGSSESALPVMQQPCFRAKYLLDEIEHVCRRTGHDATRIWTPPLFVFILRSLLDSIHPALGSLHACSVIRRVRILVCVGGDVALQDYPLEMLLHSLRPYLTDPHCAEDTIGLVQYLFAAGKIYLTQVPSFVAGISLSILGSLPVFLDSSPDKTSQQTQFQATKTKAETFQTWFGSYLDSYTPPSISRTSEGAFRNILRCVRRVGAHGSARRGTNESDLLRELLEDETAGRHLLSRPSYNLAFSLLCREFQRPHSFRDDFLGDDTQSRLNAVTIWKSCQRSGVGHSYLLWAGRVLGRAYATSGCVPRDLLVEFELYRVKEYAHSSNPQASGPTAALLRLLRDQLLSDDRFEVSLAEKTLQRIMLRLLRLGGISECQQVLPVSLLTSMSWQDHDAPDIRLPVPSKEPVQQAAGPAGSDLSFEQWIRQLGVALAYAAGDDAVVGALPGILSSITGFAERAFPYILQVILLQDLERAQTLRNEISEGLKYWLRTCSSRSTAHVKLILTALLYLRTQSMPREVTKADRERWLELDYHEAAEAARKCKMFKTALLYIEIYFSQAARTSRRSSSTRFPEPTSLLLEIFKSIDEPDSFYGVGQQADLTSIIDRLDYERDGPKSLSFRGAHYDSRLRQGNRHSLDTTGLIRALGYMDLSGLSYSMLEHQGVRGASDERTESMYQAARKLEQWDLPSTTSHMGEEARIYRAFQCLNNTSDRGILAAQLDSEFLGVMNQVVQESHSSLSIQMLFRTLAVLTEIDEVTTSEDRRELQETWQRFLSRSDWMHVGRIEDVGQIMSARDITFSTLARHPPLQEMFRCHAQDIRTIQVDAVLRFSRMTRKHGCLQASLAAAMFLSELIEPCEALGLSIRAIAQYEAANVLWDQGEMTASIRMLQNLRTGTDKPGKPLAVGSAELLARLGHQVSEARLEKPEEVISRYLLPAIKELHGASEGDEAGQVFHEFATFCDRQLQDADILEDFQRVGKLRQRKEAEVNDLEKMLNSAGTQNKSNLQIHRARAKQWFDLDDREYQRLLQSRQTFLRQSLENYLLCLKACDRFDNDVLRFCALWLEHSDIGIANAAVSQNLKNVPSRKFAPLMNQLSSRLLDVVDDFQSLLFSLILRICVDHPYHGLYQIFSTSRSKGKDESALSRHAAAVKMGTLLKKDPSASSRWLAVYNTNMCYTRLALEKLDDRYKPGSKVPLRKIQAGQRLEQEIPANRIPPPTLRIKIRADCDYSKVPIITKFQPEFTIAGGVSAPKIVTALGSDGVKYKQLIKGGNDDLRQDAIMEQVFEQVSELLQHDRLTRQRNLGIRTYKVMPLSTNAGIIEFVSNTIPLHDYLMPAHQKHFPKDWKPQVCRKNISDVQSKSIDIRTKVYRQVTEHFHPVLRYFFMERFDNPDDWFEKRLAYSRSTASISILGWVLGLGDRHGHNILLDELTGEVVHIDLGVAFEQGRVLPVPEVVPFRLTRDIVDAMGITKTEGVFRRCCEFTLDALRKESYTIRTVLDVLRYDPLYSWTVSPLRIKKMQEQSNVPQPSIGEAAAGISFKSKDANEPSEADRALTVVVKKLSKTLSVTAIVNELIQQATDERNLAVLYSGWAAYA